MKQENYHQKIDPKKYQVLLFVSRVHVPFGFAAHPWFVCNKHGELSRWEVLFQKDRCKTSWGHLHKDFLPAFTGLSTFPFINGLHQPGRLIGVVEGNEHSVAREMIEMIESSPEKYPYCQRYRLWGPNSNTFVQWVLTQFPASGLSLPWNAIGKHM